MCLRPVHDSVWVGTDTISQGHVEENIEAYILIANKKDYCATALQSVVYPGN